VVSTGQAAGMLEENATPTLIGEAYGIKSKQLQYREFHYYSRSGEEHRVVYKDPDDQVIAEKTLRYTDALSEPAVEQKNTLCGEYIKVNQFENGDRLRIVYRSEKGKRTREKAINRPDNLVIDAGFNFHVRTKWDELVAGKTVKFNYLAPSRSRTYAFKAEATECQREGEVNCFAIAPDVWYLNIALDPILLTYSADSHELLAFSGLGNIADKNCDYMAVDIQYRYPKQTL